MSYTDFWSPSKGDPDSDVWARYVVDHAFEKPYSYMLRYNTTRTMFEALYGKKPNQAGKIFYDNADAGQLIQTVFNALANGDSVYFEPIEFPITTGLTLSKRATLHFDSGNDEFAATGARISSVNDITLLTVAALGNYSIIENGLFKVTHASPTLPMVQSTGLRVGWRFCRFYSGYDQLQLDGALDEVIGCKFVSFKHSGLRKNSSSQTICLNRIDSAAANTTGLYISDGGFDTVFGNYVKAPTACEINAPNKYIVLQSNKIHDGTTVNILITDVKVCTLQNLVTEDSFSINIDVVSVSEWLELQNVAVHQAINNTTGIRQQGGTILLQGVSVEKKPAATGCTSWSKTGGTTIQRGCYSFDGLLEAL